MATTFLLRQAEDLVADRNENLRLDRVAGLAGLLVVAVIASWQSLVLDIMIIDMIEYY
jgi:hypothetical protein